MPRKRIITPEKLRDELVKTYIQVKKGEITPSMGNSAATLLKGALYSFQVEGGIREPTVVEEVEMTSKDRKTIDALVNTIKVGLGKIE